MERNLKALGEERKTEMKVKRKKKNGGAKFLLRFADDPIRFWVRKRNSETKDKK